MRFLIGFLAFIMLVSGQGAAAHEVRPAIGDLFTEDNRLVLELRLFAEPILAGADLEGVEDTNATEQAEDIETLRALSTEALTERLQADAARFAETLSARAGDSDALALSLTTVEVEAVEDLELPRETRLRLEAELPGGARTVSLTWPARYGTLILRQQGVDDPYTGYLDGGDTGPIEIGGGDAQGAAQVFVNYIPVGFDHILPKGLDHILFVLGLFFLSTRLGPLLWQISAFTLAHTVTLALGALGYVNIPGSIVEPIIAASIVYVAVENIVSDKLHRWRPAVIFVFGLLHGLGFASVLGEFGLPEGQFIPALIGFNIGVEIGQLTVIAMAFALVLLARRVDEGDTHPKIGQVLYGVLAVVLFSAGFALNGGGFVETMGAGAPVFFWPLAFLAVCCMVSATLVDHMDAYRKFVAVPASLFIACVGAWWFLERVFL